MSVLQETQWISRAVYSLPLDRIAAPAPLPRTRADEHGLMELAASIRQHGLMQPITVRPEGAGYAVVLGERRRQACLMLGFTHIDAFVVSLGAEDALRWACMDNIHRESLHFLDAAQAYDTLCSQGMAPEALARLLGKSPAAIQQKRRLLALPPALQDYLRETNLTERHAKILLTLPPGPEQTALAHQAAQLGLSVRETEALALKARSRLPQPPPGRKVISLVRDPRLYMNAIRALARQMEEAGLETDLQTQEDENWLTLRLGVRKERR